MPFNNTKRIGVVVDQEPQARHDMLYHVGHIDILVGKLADNSFGKLRHAWQRRLHCERLLKLHHLDLHVDQRLRD